jgi:hypothetical protein
VARGLIFGQDVSQLEPKQSAIVDAQALWYPIKSLKEAPAGD